MTEHQKTLLKKYPPIPITKSEKRKLMRISGRTAILMLIIMAACAVFGLIKDDLVVMLAIGGIFCIIALMLEMKDKIKYCTYKRIETILVYIDKYFYAPSGYKLEIIYYDPTHGAYINKTIYINKIDVIKNRINAGSIEKMLVGFKKSKIYYIKSKEMYGKEDDI